MSHALVIPFLALVSTAAVAQESFVPEVKTAPRAYTAEQADSELVGPQAANALAAPPARELTAPPRATRSDHSRLYFDVATDGTVWVRGRTYKASFAADAATYVPFLGSSAPRNFPVGLHVESVTIGGEPLVFDTSVPAVRHGDTIEYARGPFVERYLLSLDSVEQTFVFESLPRQGEIVVTLGVTSELEGASDVEGFRFGNELGHVRYGRAFAFHDGADLTPIASRLSGGAIELIAPAELVAGASGRFVIDPVLSTFSLETAAIDEFAADTAYDLTNGVWLTVCEEIFSSTDRDIHAVRHTTAGTVSASDYVDFTTDIWRAPAIANHLLDDQFLVVAVEGSAPNRQIMGRTVEATVSLNMSAQFLVSDDAYIGDCYAPDVGGDPSTSGTAYYCVVWEREFSAGADYDIHGRLVRTDATLVGGTTFYVDNSVSVHRNPAISNSNGNASDALQDWNVVWEDEVTATNRNILGARVHRDGSLTETTFTVASSTLDERNPSATAIVDATAGTRPWMVAYQIDSGANGWDVRCRTFNNASSISTFDLSEQFAGVANDQITPSCDCDGDQFVVAYDERTTPTFFSTDIKVSTLYSLGGVLGVNEGNVSVSPGFNTDVRPRIVCNASSGSSLDDAMVVFDRDSADGDQDVWATGYDLPNGGPVSSYCSGDGTGSLCPCANNGNSGNGCASSVSPGGANLASTGAADLSTDTLTLVATAMPATASALFFQGTVQSNGGAGIVFGDGLRCVGGTVIRLGTKTASGGSASYPTGADPDISVRGVIPPAGAVRYYQCWYRNAAAFCTASTFNLTNGLRVQWIP